MLLVIFIITTTPVVNDLNVNLPSAAKRLKDPKPKVNYVTIETSGRMFLNKDEVTIDTLQEKVVRLRLEDQDLNMCIRGAAKAKYQRIVEVMDKLQQANVAKVNLATEPFADAGAKKE